MNIALPPAVQSAVETVKRLAAIRRKEPKCTVGVDLGASSLKIVALGARKASGLRPVLAQRVAPVPEAADDDRLAGLLKDTMNSLQLPVTTVTLSISGQWVVMRVVEMPALKPEELTRALPFEAQRHVPFNIQDVVLDGAMLGPADGGKMWVLIVAGKREMLERRIAVVKRAGLEPGAIDVDALAMANAFLAQPNGQPAAGTQALLNLGTQWTNLVILKDRVPYLVRDVPWGSSRLVHQTAEQLGVEEAAVTAQLLGGSATPEFIAALKAGCESVTADLQLSFDFFESRFGTPPDRILVSGGLSQSSSLLEALKGHLAQPLQTWVPREGVSSQLAVAYGLALRPGTAT